MEENDLEKQLLILNNELKDFLKERSQLKSRNLVLEEQHDLMMKEKKILFEKLEIDTDNKTLLIKIESNRLDIEYKRKEIENNRKDIENNRKDIENYAIKQDNLKGFNISQLLSVQLPIITYGHKLNHSSTNSLTDFLTKPSEWKKFHHNMYLFKDLVIGLDKHFYKKCEFKEEIIVNSHDYLQRNLVNICNEVFYERIFKNEIEFIEKPNREEDLYVRGDVFLRKPKDENINKKNKVFLFEVKTKLTLPCCQSIIKSDSAHANNAIAQVFDYLHNGNTNYAILSNIDNSWCFYRKEKNLFISNCVEKKDLILAVYYMTCHLLTDFGNEQIQDFIKQIKNNDEKNHDDQNPKLINHSYELRDRQVKNKDYKLNKSDYNNDSAYESSLNLSLIPEDQIFDAMPLAKVLGFGACGTVLKIVINDNQYALKICDVFKTSKESLRELANEVKILDHLKDFDYSPKKIQSGLISINETILMTYIDGTQYKLFDKMEPKHKANCYQSLKKLHQMNCLHGDIKASNFIVDKDDKVFVIDFGRSRILESSVDSQRLFDEEMAKLLKVMNYEID